MSEERRQKTEFMFLNDLASIQQFWREKRRKKALTNVACACLGKGV